MLGDGRNPPLLARLDRARSRLRDLGVDVPRDRARGRDAAAAADARRPLPDRGLDPLRLVRAPRPAAADAAPVGGRGRRRRPPLRDRQRRRRLGRDPDRQRPGGADHRDRAALDGAARPRRPAPPALAAGGGRDRGRPRRGRVPRRPGRGLLARPRRRSRARLLLLRVGSRIALRDTRSPARRSAGRRRLADADGRRRPLCRGGGAVVGIAVGLAGVAYLVDPAGASSRDLVAAVALVFSSFAWAAGSLYATRAARPADPLVGVALQMLTGGVVLCAAGVGRWSGSRSASPGSRTSSTRPAPPRATSSPPSRSSSPPSRG